MALKKISEDKQGMFRASLQILIVIWWIGAGIATIAIIFHKYEQYAVVGSTGWIITIASTALIIYEIKRIRAEDKELMENGGT
jgi:membrane associated rhomboid family serine protease